MIRSALPLIVLAGLIAVHVPSIAAAQAKPAKPAAAKAAPTGAVNLNTATVADLQTLPGIGAATAGRIIEYRQKNGPFKKIEELMNVRGVGEKSFLKLKPRLTVGAPKAAEGQPEQK